MDRFIVENMALRAELAIVMANLTALLSVLEGRAPPSCPSCPGCVCSCAAGGVEETWKGIKLDEGGEVTVGLLLEVLNLLRSPVLALLLVLWGKSENGRCKAVLAAIVLFFVDPVGSLTWLLLQAGETCLGLLSAGQAGTGARNGIPVGPQAESETDPDAEAEGDVDEDAAAVEGGPRGLAGVGQGGGNTRAHRSGRRAGTEADLEAMGVADTDAEGPAPAGEGFLWRYTIGALSRVLTGR